MQNNHGFSIKIQDRLELGFKSVICFAATHSVAHQRVPIRAGLQLTRTRGAAKS
jgi:hypothetical protein